MISPLIMAGIILPIWGAIEDFRAFEKKKKKKEADKLEADERWNRHLKALDNYVYENDHLLPF